MSASIDDIQEEGVEEGMAMEQNVVERMEGFFIEFVQLGNEGCFIYYAHG